MQVPLQLEFRNMDHSGALEAAVRERIDKLEPFADSIIRCRAIIELPRRRIAQGEVYHVLLDIEVPGSEIIVTRDPRPLEAHVDPFLAVKQAFDVAERQLQDYAERTHAR
jgi:ribosome-associated translation inhibitor RaiA